jgi:hypothetical protein
MRQELDDLLCQRYPDIFRDRHGDPTETSMCWGFTCGDGWFQILDDLCAEITRQVKAGTMPPVVAKQIKEKSGYLRIYIRDHFNRKANPEAHRLIQLAQERAERTCEVCGHEVEAGEDLRLFAKCARCVGEAK